MPKGIFPRPVKFRMKRHEVSQPLDKPYRFIPLTRNQNAIVDVEDFDWLSQWNWVAHWDEDTRGFYAKRTAYGPKRTVLMHREILACQRGEYADHGNHNTLDNRRCNLRKVTAAQNSANAMKHTGKLKGISLRHGGWIARIWVQGRNKHLGRFSSPEEAARAYDEAAKKFFGEFAHINGS